MKKDILLDVDEVVCFSGFLEAVNNFLNTNYIIDDFNDYYIDKTAIPKEKFNDFVNYLNNINRYEQAILLPNAKEVIEKLNKIYNIYICSSCINPFDIKGSGKLFKDKYDFLISTLPYLNPKNFIFTDAKHLFKADIQIDDRLSNLDNDIDLKILFPSYHNKMVSDKELKENNVIRAGYSWKNGWKEVEKILIKERK